MVAFVDKNSSSGRQVIIYTGYLFALVFITMIIIVAFLFMSPGSSVLGVTSVNARQVYTTYTADNIPGIRDVLLSRNIIIESSFIDVEIRVRMLGQQDEGSIQVWENSSGLSFNSVKRTYVEWTQVIVPRKHVNETNGDVTYTSEIYYKITIIEPKGVVSRSDNSCVIINMYATEDNSEMQSPFNFILNTGNSEVRFASDNDSVVLRNPLNVANLEIVNASGKIYLPPAPVGTSAGSFYVNVGNVIVDTYSSNLVCESPVSGNVSVKCNAGSYSFRNIGGDVSIKGGSCSVYTYNIDGDVKISGTSVAFTQRNGAVAGDVDFDANNGKLSIVSCQRLDMVTVNATLFVSGKVSELFYEATGIGGLDVAQIKGGAEAKVKTVSGSIKLYKVSVDTSVESRTGAVIVDFDSTIVLGDGNEPSFKARSYDGNITAGYICGNADIFVSALGNANIYADFRQVKDVCSIVYEGSTNPKRNKGEISVTFVTSISYCIMNIDRMASAHNRISHPMITTKDQQIVAKGASFVNGAFYYVNYANRTGESTGNLRISTSNSFNLYNR